jgi:hypothetical protein
MPKVRKEIPTSAAAWAQARECDRLASITTLDSLQNRFLRLRDSWIIVATELERIEKEKFTPGEPPKQPIIPDGPEKFRAH